MNPAAPVTSIRGFDIVYRDLLRIAYTVFLSKLSPPAGAAPRCGTGGVESSILQSISYHNCYALAKDRVTHWQTPAEIIQYEDEITMKVRPGAITV